MRFSKELVEKTTEYFHRKYGRELTDGETTSILERLGSLANVAHAVEEGNAGAIGTKTRASRSSLRDRGAGCVAPGCGLAEKNQSHGDTDLVAQYHQSASVDSSEN